MSVFLVLALLAGGDATPPSPTYAQRASEIAAEVRGGRWSDGLAAVDAALAAPGLGERQTAELQHARGVILLAREIEPPTPSLPGAPLASPSRAAPGAPGAPAAPAPDEPGLPAARDAFSLARALAGPTPLRLDATYDMGLVTFHEGERARAQLPEISGAPPAAPAGMALPSAAPASPAPQGPDPLAVAREAYTKARAVFVERLRADWRDEDTRANLELIQRRLAELDAIEKKREEEKKQQEQQQQQQDPQDQKDQQQQDPSQDPQPQDGKDPQKGDPSQKPQDSDSKAQGKDGEDESQNANPNPEGTRADQAPEAPQESGDESQEPQAAPDAEPQATGPGAEAHLTREEVQQLLDKLADLEKQAGALEAALRAARRVPVTRDW